MATGRARALEFRRFPPTDRTRNTNRARQIT